MKPVSDITNLGCRISTRKRTTRSMMTTTWNSTMPMIDSSDDGAERERRAEERGRGGDQVAEPAIGRDELADDRTDHREGDRHLQPAEHERRRRRAGGCGTAPAASSPCSERPSSTSSGGVASRPAATEITSGKNATRKVTIDARQLVGAEHDHQQRRDRDLRAPTASAPAADRVRWPAAATRRSRWPAGSRS